MKKNLSASLILTLFAFASCTCNVGRNPFFDEQSSLAIPCNINKDTTIVLIRDFFPKIEEVENVISSDYIIQPFSGDGGSMDTVMAIAAPDTKAISVIEVISKNEKGIIVMKKEKKTGNNTPAMASTALSADGKKITIRIENSPADFIVLWQNTLLDNRFISRRKAGNVGNAGNVEELVIKVPDNAAELEKSFIRVYASNAEGSGNDILIPLEKGVVITDPALLTRQDRRTWMMYQIMIDRFYNGNTENDWKIRRRDVLPKVDYYGGDIAGVDLKLNEGYFDSLGINTLWISPISQNPYTAWGENFDPYTKFSGYHGYWPVFVTKVDKRYGTPEEVRKLIADVHARNDNIILDYVANHVHIESPILQNHPDWVTPSVTPDGRPNFELWDEFRLTTWFDKHIPTLDLEREDVNEPMTDSAMVWMKDYDFDGFRHDATKHIPEVYWRKLTKKILTQITDRDIFQIGETYGSPALISSYVRTGMLDCQFDFNIYDSYIYATTQDGGSFENLAGTIDESLHIYGSHNIMGIISGNHDRARYVSIAGGDLKWGEDFKKAGWKRKIGVGDSSAYNKLSMLFAMNFTLPGIPCIYTGDEFGQPGGNDPDNRRWAQFRPLNDYEKQVEDDVKFFTRERRNNMALLYGDFHKLAAEKDFFAYIRIYMGEYYILALNKSDKIVKKELRLPFGLKTADGKETLAVEVKPLSYFIYNFNK